MIFQSAPSARGQSQDSQLHLAESPLLHIEPLSFVIPFLRIRQNLGRLLSPRRRRTRLGSRSGRNLGRLCCFDGRLEESRAEAERAVGCEDALGELARGDRTVLRGYSREREDF